MGGSHLHLLPQPTLITATKQITEGQRPPYIKDRTLASNEVARLLEEDKRTDRGQTLWSPLDGPCLHDAV